MKKANGQRKRLFAPKAPRKDLSESVVETLAKETCRTLDKQLAAALKGYDPDRTPLGKAEAELLLQRLIRTAAAARALLPARLLAAMECEEATPHADWYKELRTVCELSVQMEADAAAMRRAEEDYRYLSGVYNRVRAAAYKTAVLPAQEELAEAPCRDTWKILTEETV